MARLVLTVFGGFEARVNPPGRPLHVPLKKGRAILAMLAWAPGGARTRETLIGLLWPELDQAQARNSFRVTLSSLRTSLAAARIEGLRVEGDTVALDPANVTSDVAAFRRLVALGTPEELSEAVGLYRGDLLDGLDVGAAAFDEWLSTEREQLRIVAQGACERLLAHQLRAGADEFALATALRLVALDPLLEPVHRTVMRLQAKCGRFGAARRQYQACATALQRELGVAPGAETRRLYEEIVRSSAHDRGSVFPSRHATDDALGHPSPAASWLPSRDLPQVGRIEEMARLREALVRARRGQGQCLAVVGEAGIGKTRLVSELAGEALRSGTRVWLGRAYESDRILTFGPWVDAIRASGLVEDGAWLAGLSPVWRAELGRLVPELGEPSREGSRHQDGVRRLFEAVVQLVRHVIDREPLVLILEDVHWADELSVRLLAFLARRIAGWPVLILVTAREEEVDARSMLQRTLEELAPAGLLARVSVSTLTLEDTTRLVNEIVLADRKKIETESAARQIWALSQGNPFMIVEAVRALGEGASAPAEGILPLPPRVRELVASRLDRLSERGRRLIAVAAVIGRACEFRVLWRASGLGDIEAAEAVEELTRRRLVHQLGNGFDVTHDWVRDVAYHALQAALRQVLHSAVARALEEQYAANLEPHYPELARHYRDGEVWDKAVFYLHATGRAAAARVGHREAVSRFEAALDALSRLPEGRDTIEQGVDLRLDLRYSLSGLGEFERLIGHLREAEPLARKLDDQGRLGWVRVYVGYYTRMVRRPIDAYTVARSAHTIARTIGDVELEVEADYELGMAHLFAGDHDRAQDLLLRAFRTGSARLERPRGRAVTALSARSYLTRSLAECGHFEDALVHGRETLDLAEQLCCPINIVIAHSELSNLHEHKGEFDRAIPILERGLAIAAERELTLLTPGVMGSLASAYTRAGRVADGLAMLGETLTMFEPIGVRSSQAHVVVKLVEACLVGNRLEQAGLLAARALALTREYGLRGWEAYVLRLLGEVAVRGGAPVAEAEGHYRAALTRSHELGLRPLEARCHVGLGALYRGAGRRQEAAPHITAATTMCREMDMRYWLEMVGRE